MCIYVCIVWSVFPTAFIVPHHLLVWRQVHTDNTAHYTPSGRGVRTPIEDGTWAVRSTAQYSNHCTIRYPAPYCTDDVENVSVNFMPGPPCWFYVRPLKFKLCRERRNFASCQVSLNSVQRLQRRSQKISANQSLGQQSVFSDRPEKTPHKL